jgi:hypothetical protein
MVIMALLPKAVDLEERPRSISESDTQKSRAPLKIATPPRLPEAIAGRPYLVALAVTGGSGPAAWSVEGTLPDWLTLDRDSGRIGGTPPSQLKEPLAFEIQVTDGVETVSSPVQLAVLPYQSETTYRMKRFIGGVPWRAWLEQGVGFLLLWLVHLVGMNLLANIERGSLADTVDSESPQGVQLMVRKRFAAYRTIIRVATLAAMAALLSWLILAPMLRH